MKEDRENIFDKILVLFVYSSYSTRYNPKMNSWTKQAPMLSRRSGATAAVMDGQLYVIGGSDGNAPMNTGLNNR